MVYKRKLPSGTVDWCYTFDLPGSSKTKRLRKQQTGFPTKKAAIKAESTARLQEHAKPSGPPKTLKDVIAAFIEDRSSELSPKTVERYRELAAYIDPGILNTQIAEITAHQLHDEWKRLLKSGGHTRGEKTARPLSAKTVRNVAGVVSSAYGWAILYDFARLNPVTASKLPRGGEKRQPMALAPSQQETVIQAASGPWCMETFLELSAALGARRGEVLALRWSDIQGNVAHIRRSLCQTKDGLSFKSTKGKKPRTVTVPERTLAALEAHRRQQAVYREQFSDWPAKDLIFTSETGEMLKPDSVSAAASRICRLLKLPKGVSLHALRHSHGSQLIADGVPVPEVSERLGHSNAATTLSIYAHAIPGKTDAAARWEALQPTPERKERRQ